MAIPISAIEAQRILEDGENIAYCGWRVELMALNEARQHQLQLSLPLILEAISASNDTIWSIKVRDMNGATLDIGLGWPTSRKFFVGGSSQQDAVEHVNMFNSLGFGKAIVSDVSDINRP